MVEWRLHDGLAVVAKPCTPTRTPTDRRRELDLLLRLDHPGFVRPARDDLTAEGSLLLIPAGTSTLATADADHDHLVAVCASVADTLAMLHAAGIVHGAVAPEHVLWSPGHTPVLCGFGSAVAGSDVGPDIDGLRDLLRPVAATDARVERIVAGATADAASLARALRTVTLRPIASRRRRLNPPMGSMLVGSMLMGSMVVAALVLVAALELGRGPTDSGVPVPTPTVVDAPPQTWLPSLPVCRPAVVAGSTIGLADVDGDGCIESVGREGTVLRAGPRRFRLGDPADAVVVGDWWCTGRATAALVRHLTGAVHLFAAWPTDVPAAVVAVAMVGPNRGVEIVPSPAGCDGLAIALADGTLTTVDP